MASVVAVLSEEVERTARYQEEAGVELRRHHRDPRGQFVTVISDEQIDVGVKVWLALNDNLWVDGRLTEIIVFEQRVPDVSLADIDSIAIVLKIRDF